MEREVILSGVGGQGVQLAAQVLARAAVREDRRVMLLGTNGGTMRGGNTDSMLVVADAPISAPPILSHAWAALVLHPQFFAPLRSKLRPGAVVLVNSSIDGEALGDADARRTASLFQVPATERATALGSAMAASMVMIGAFAGLTALVGLESLVAAMGESVPSYRRQHLAWNEAALRAGFDAVPSGAAPAWAVEATP